MTATPRRVIRRRGDGRYFGAAFLSLIALLVTACATPPQTAALRAKPISRAPVELTGVPFFTQEAYQCGPAALAMVLGWSGVSVTPNELTPQVYMPSRQGSLQIELLGATRRHGRIPYILQPRLTDLFDELSAGHPVLVLLNLGLSWYPVWHYAVVVGYEPFSNQVIMRSGRLPRDVVQLEVFERIWARSGFWALLTLAPEQLPATAQELPYLQSVMELERLQQWQIAASAYETALTRWPNSLGAALGMGNSRYALTDFTGAEMAFRRALMAHPDAATAYNNLAEVLSEQGRYPEAKIAAKKAIEIGGPLLETYQGTLRQINERAQSAQP